MRCHGECWLVRFRGKTNTKIACKGCPTEPRRCNSFPLSWVRLPLYSAESFVSIRSLSRGCCLRSLGCHLALLTIDLFPCLYLRSPHISSNRSSSVSTISNLFYGYTCKPLGLTTSTNTVKPDLIEEGLRLTSRSRLSLLKPLVLDRS